VAQTTRYDDSVKAGYVDFINDGLTLTNVYFDLAAGTILAGRGERTHEYEIIGYSSRCTVLLGATVDGENLPQ
jgi:hypothetical protein